jgi:WD40 repeat protein
VILWDVVVGQPLGQPFASETDWVTSVVFSPDGQTLTAGSRDGAVTVWDVGLERWKQAACAIANRNFSESERLQYLPGLADQPVCAISLSAQ